MQQQGLPESFRKTWEEHIVPLATWIETRKKEKTLVVGINGAQGSGKSTLAAALDVVLSEKGVRVARLSLDDLYLTLDERKQLAKHIHPLLQTRGVPGTHDVGLGVQSLKQLISGAGEVMVPRFDKACDDRAAKEDWTPYTAPVDIVLFEGWCVGTPPQPLDALSQPINALEKEEDTNGLWRTYVNQALATSYPQLFTMIDTLVFLQAPNFEAVLQWRMKQEHQTFASQMAKAMDEYTMQWFLQHFERLTRHALAELPSKADKVLKLDDRQNIVG